MDGNGKIGKWTTNTIAMDRNGKIGECTMQIIIMKDWEWCCTTRYH
jgi:hypothetical protein